MLEHKLYLAQDDMSEGDRVFLTTNGSGFPATCKVGGTAITEHEAKRMIESGRKCCRFGGVSVKRGEAVCVNPWKEGGDEIIACLQ